MAQEQTEWSFPSIPKLDVEAAEFGGCNAFRQPLATGVLNSKRIIVGFPLRAICIHDLIQSSSQAIASADTVQLLDERLRLRSTLSMVEAFPALRSRFVPVSSVSICSATQRVSSSQTKTSEASRDN